uniref:hypothetical protein n=1 Tax=Pseudomonas viridiflava TaxID=33069 RepID=UPI00197D1CA1
GTGRYVTLTKDGFRAKAVIATSLVEDWDLDAQICSRQLTSPSETAMSDFQRGEGYSDNGTSRRKPDF